MRRVAVIGGGIAGLIAAWELSRNGIDVALFERAARLGGRVCSGEIDGLRFDLGPESYATRGGEVERLLTDLGLSDQITTTSGGRSWVIGDGRAAPLPAAVAIGIPARPMSAEVRRVIGSWGALRCAIEPWLPRSVGRREATLGGLVRARLGQRTLDRLVAPVVRGIYSANPHDLPVAAVPGLANIYAERGSLRAAARKQRGSERASGSAVAGIRGGIHTLVMRLADELERLGARVYLETEVTALRASGAGQNSGHEVVAEGLERACHVDAVLVTVPGIAGVTPLSAEDEVPTHVEVVALMVEEARLHVAPRGTGALVAEDARRANPPIQAKALTHANQKWNWLAEQLPENRHLVRLSYGEHGASAATLGMADADVVRLALADASAILGVELLESALVGMARQTHTILRGQQDSQVMKALQSCEVTSPRGVFLAGEWVSGTGFAAVIPAAREVASALLTTLTTLPTLPTPGVPGVLASPPFVILPSSATLPPFVTSTPSATLSDDYRRSHP